MLAAPLFTARNGPAPDLTKAAVHLDAGKPRSVAAKHRLATGALLERAVTASCAR